MGKQISKRFLLIINLYTRLITRASQSNNVKKKFRLLELWQTGMTRFWIESFLPRADEFFAKKPHKSTAAILIKLVDLTSAFLIFGLGVASSIIMFLIELIFYHSLQ